MRSDLVCFPNERDHVERYKCREGIHAGNCNSIGFGCGERAVVVALGTTTNRDEPTVAVPVVVTKGQRQIK